MAYKLAVKIATKSACYNDPRKMQGPLGAMLHSVGCSQPSAENWANRWNSPTATVCATYVIEPTKRTRRKTTGSRPIRPRCGRSTTRRLKAEKSMTGCNQQARMTHTTPEIASDSKARSMKA